MRTCPRPPGSCTRPPGYDGYGRGHCGPTSPGGRRQTRGHRKPRAHGDAGSIPGHTPGRDVRDTLGHEALALSWPGTIFRPALNTGGASGVPSSDVQPDHDTTRQHNVFTRFPGSQGDARRRPAATSPSVFRNYRQSELSATPFLVLRCIVAARSAFPIMISGFAILGA